MTPQARALMAADRCKHGEAAGREFVLCVVCCREAIEEVHEQPGPDGRYSTEAVDALREQLASTRAALGEALAALERRPTWDDREPRSPRRRYSLWLDLGADTMQDLLGALEQIQFDVSRSEGYLHSTTGGPTRGWWVRSAVDEQITHESYFEAIDAYLARVRANRGEVAP